MLSALEEDRARVADIEAQIRDLEGSISILRAQKALVQERLDSYTYPVLTLPNEITSEIFIHFLPPYPICPPLAGLLSPTLLAQICCTWRAIALATPALWSVIPLPFSDVPRNFDPTSTWLSRSRCCPLSVHIIEEEYKFSTPEAYSELVAQRARWEYLKMELCDHFKLRTIEGVMPQLRQLDVDLERIRGGNTPFLVVCSEAPLLRSVILNDVAALKVVLPWGQLTALTLKAVYPHECIPILQQTPALVSCELDLVFHESVDSLPEVRLPRLQSLILNDEEEPLTPYINTFVVPALRHLQIPEVYLRPDRINTLSSFISKSGCVLQELDITAMYSDMKALRDYVRAFPSISRISLNGVCASGADLGQESVSRTDE